MIRCILGFAFFTSVGAIMVVRLAGSFSRSIQNKLPCLSGAAVLRRLRLGVGGSPLFREPCLC